MTTLSTRLTKALMDKALVPPDRLKQVVTEAQAGHKNFVRLLIDRRLITEEQLFSLLAEDLKIPTISLTKYRIDPKVARLVPERLARQYTLTAVSRLGQRLVVAMSDPLNVFALDDLKMLTGCVIDPVLAPEAEIRRAIEQVYQPGETAAASDDAAGASEPEPAAPGAQTEIAGQVVDLDAVAKDGEEAPAVRMINLMLVEALQQRASDIHLEPMDSTVRVRYRVDGHLLESHQLPKAIQNTLLTRLKIMSGMDITEWRLPQDGRFKIRHSGQEVDFRVSILPLTHGGKVVLRVLNNASLSIGLDHLGFLPESITAFQEAVKRPYGMLLVTGPTGSGKSTTLYSVLNQLNSIARNIITVEDPVEYQVEGITQVQVNPEIGLTFASGLRSILRQNPDVVMIGEIRDAETADIAMKASLTGHLVLSTLHTNDAASAVTRLVDMGVEPFLVASSLTLIEAQRLVRKLCEKCRKAYTPSDKVLDSLGLSAHHGATFYEPVGCRTCGKSGYRGRFGVVEVILVDDPIREMVLANAPSWEIKRHAAEHLKMRNLREDGIAKALRGDTSLQEVLHVTAGE